MDKKMDKHLGEKEGNTYPSRDQVPLHIYKKLKKKYLYGV